MPIAIRSPIISNDRFGVNEHSIVLPRDLAFKHRARSQRTGCWSRRFAAVFIVAKTGLGSVTLVSEHLGGTIVPDIGGTAGRKDHRAEKHDQRKDIEESHARTFAANISKFAFI